MHILIAEDEKKVAGFIRKALKEASYTVDEVHDGHAALSRALLRPYDAIVLDIMMPGRDGLSVLRLLRAQRIDTPVLILSARDGAVERAEGLELGADDYLAKPFAMRELLARIGAIVRRGARNATTLLNVGDITMNVVTREVTRAGKSVHLAVREFALLEYFMRAPGVVHTRTSLCEHVWDYHFDTCTNVVDVYIQRLRQKLDGDRSANLFFTVRGVGYGLGPSAG